MFSILHGALAATTKWRIAAELFLRYHKIIILQVSYSLARFDLIVTSRFVHSIFSLIIH